MRIVLHYGPIQPFFLNTANLSHLRHPPHPRPPRPSAWMTLRVTCAGRRIMIVYTAAAALRLGRVVVVVVRHSGYNRDRPCDVMKRQFVLLSLPSLVPSFRDTYVVFPYKDESKVLLFPPQLGVFRHRFWSYPQTDSPEKRERGHDFDHLRARALQVRKSLPEQFYFKGSNVLSGPYLPSRQSLQFLILPK